MPSAQTTITLFASIGFVLAVSSFLSGFFRASKPQAQQREKTMHRVNGYLTIGSYLVVAFFSIAKGTTPLYLLAWALGLFIHLSKVLLVRKGLAVRYGGYFGALLLITWVVVIFTHLPN